MPEYRSYNSELIEELNEYESKGQAEGAEHRPPSNAVQPDQHESVLITRAEKHLGAEQRFVDLAAADAHKTSSDVEQKVVDLRGRMLQLLGETSALLSVEAELADERRQLLQATEVRMRSQVDWRHFRSRHNITRQATYPESQLLHFGIVGACALAETIMNAVFFQNDQGLIGGFVVALGVSALNMCSALVLGILFRYIHVPFLLQRAIGYASLVAFAATTIFCNTLFATFRTQYQLLQEPSDLQQLARAFSSSWSAARQIFYLSSPFTDLMSFVLFGVGLGLSVLAFYKGYTFDDKVPGYGKVDREVRRTQTLEGTIQDSLRNKLKLLLQKRITDVASARQEPTQLIGQCARRIAELQTKRQELLAQAKSIQRDLHLVLRGYRNGNVAVRATEPPAYFSQFPAIAARADTTEVDDVTTRLTNCQAELERLRAEYDERLQSCQEGLQKEAATVLKETWTLFLHDIERESQDSINRSTGSIEKTASAAG